ncbi:MAG: type II toxin-antitoxin system VapC family toxin [Chlorobi bacterium]|nr:type II toxin-antitoxin system VapC family toxin [Chlorobiota bacterium]
MEVICLNTGILIEFYRSKYKHKTLLFELAKEYQFAIPAIVKYEVLRGDKKKDIFWVKFFKKSKILPFDDQCSQIASNIYKNLKQGNYLIGTDDILIASTAIGNNHKLATLNKKDFNRINELELITR